MSLALFAKELRGGLFSFCAVTAVLALYIVSIVYMFNPDVVENLDAVMASMPELFAAFGMAHLSTTMTDFMLNYLYGFLFTWGPLLLIVMMVNRMIVRPLDRGSLACVLASPVSRLRIATTFVAVLVAFLVLELALLFIIQAASAEALFPGELAYDRLARASAGLFCLWVFMTGICFASSCLFRDTRLALWGGSGLCLFFFLMQMASQAGEGLEALQDCNPVMLFDPYELAASSGDAAMGAAVLAAFGVALCVIGVVAFCKRDINV